MLSKSNESLSIPSIGASKAKPLATESSSDVKESPKLPVVLDGKTKDKLERMRIDVKNDSSHISRILTKASKNEPRKNGIGSWGGPIARQVKSPGPHNGITYEASGIRSPQLQLSEEQMKEIMKDHDDIYLEDWNRNFIVANRLSEPRIYTKKSYDTLFRKEIKKFRSVEIAECLVKELYASSGLSESLSNMKKKKIVEANATNSLDRVLQDIGHDDNGASIATVVESETNNSNSILDIISQWEDRKALLHGTCSELTYKDCTDVACMRSPPDFIEHVLSFIGILLGLNPSWAAAKRSMFHEIASFQTFLISVDPLTIPVSRIRKAIKWKDTHLPGLQVSTCHTVYGPDAFIMLSKWVVLFHAIGQIIINVDDCLRFQLHGGMESASVSLLEYMSVTDQARSNNGIVNSSLSVLSIDTGTKNSGGTLASIAAFEKLPGLDILKVISGTKTRAPFFKLLVEYPDIVNGRFDHIAYVSAEVEREKNIATLEQSIKDAAIAYANNPQAYPESEGALSAESEAEYGEGFEEEDEEALTASMQSATGISSFFKRDFKKAKAGPIKPGEEDFPLEDYGDDEEFETEEDSHAAVKSVRTAYHRDVITPGVLSHGKAKDHHRELEKKDKYGNPIPIQHHDKHHSYEEKHSDHKAHLREEAQAYGIHKGHEGKTHAHDPHKRTGAGVHLDENYNLNRDDNKHFDHNHGAAFGFLSSEKIPNHDESKDHHHHAQKKNSEDKAVENPGYEGEEDDYGDDGDFETENAEGKSPEKSFQEDGHSVENALNIQTDVTPRNDEDEKPQSPYHDYATGFVEDAISRSVKCISPSASPSKLEDDTLLEKAPQSPYHNYATSYVDEAMSKSMKGFSPQVQQSDADAEPVSPLLQTPMLSAREPPNTP